ncbi:hypothetical protein Syun_012259 [Stephania yunnanensis]|uniref:Uncharacterized protein n=1 Tax=Stephania yunnanensis TaxID=152371 RepID=A0AAP0JZX1_9MAGN
MTERQQRHQRLRRRWRPTRGQHDSGFSGVAAADASSGGSATSGGQEQRSAAAG